MSASRGRSGWKICKSVSTRSERTSCGVLELVRVRLPGEFVAHGSTVNCLALSPSNGRTLATGGDDRKINLWIVGQPNVLTVGCHAPFRRRISNYHPFSTTGMYSV